MAASDAFGTGSAPGLGPGLAEAGLGAGRKPPQLSPQQQAQYLQMSSALNGLAGPWPGLMDPGRPCGGGGGSSHYDIARDVGQQVERMILLAKHNSETKVGQEVMKIKLKMEAIHEKLRKVSEKVGRLEKVNGTTSKDLRSSIARLEEVWEGEVGTLKHELWKTVQAHNHNADLLKHHKDAIDQLQGRLNEGFANPELDRVHEQLLQVDRSLQNEQDVKQQLIYQLAGRLEALQGQLGGAQLGGAGLGGGPPSAPLPVPAVPVLSGAQVVARPKEPAKVIQRKTGKAAGGAAQATKPPGGAPAKAAAIMAAKGASAASLRAEAPEFVPTAWPLDGA